MSIESDHSRKKTKKIGKNNVINPTSLCSYFIRFLLKIFKDVNLCACLFGSLRGLG